jgi:uncharacterized membrane protein YkvA (DUF1232 family)
MMTRLKHHLLQLQQQQEHQPIYPFGTETANPVVAEKLQRFILCLPAMLNDLNAWCEQTDGQTHIKRLYSYVLAYVFHGVDLVPEDDFGFWGYLDDAYLTGLAVAKTWGENPLGNGYSPSYMPQLQQWLSDTRTVIPSQAEQMNAVFGQMLLGNYQAFDDTLMNCQTMPS